MTTGVVTRGIVLARTDFGEADRILTVLTDKNGKIRLMAKGVRKVKSRLAGGIELFSISQITYIPGRKEISTLISSRLEKHFGKIVEDIDRTMYAYDVLKLFNKSVEDGADGEYFELLAETLNALNDRGLNQLITQLWLNIQLLKLSGRLPNLKTDNRGGKLHEKQNYDFDLSKMSFEPNPEGGYGPRHIKLLRLAQGLKSPAKLAIVNGVDSIAADCLALVTAMNNQQN